MVARVEVTSDELGKFPEAKGCFCTGKGFDGKCRCERTLREQASYEKTIKQRDSYVESYLQYEESRGMNRGD